MQARPGWQLLVSANSTYDESHRCADRRAPDWDTHSCRMLFSLAAAVAANSACSCLPRGQVYGPVDNSQLQQHQQRGAHDRVGFCPVWWGSLTALEHWAGLSLPRVYLMYLTRPLLHRCCCSFLPAMQAVQQDLHTTAAAITGSVASFQVRSVTTQCDPSH